VTVYTSLTDLDREEMLAAIGVRSVEELFADIPAGLRLDRALDLPPGAAEQEVYAELRAL
jgi:glycine dehydrogenase subunit 1